jgi:hypothetical protein
MISGLVGLVTSVVTPRESGASRNRCAIERTLLPVMCCGPAIIGSSVDLDTAERAVARA